MLQEIERKFLVKGDFRNEVFKSERIIQGYLSTIPERTVRIRIKDDKGYITVKGSSSPNGISRFEWEKQIPYQEAEALLKLCEKGIIDKTRHLIKAGKQTFEVDEFHCENEGLIIAEIELPSEDSTFEHPDWLGEEVTGNKRYYNASLMKNPYKNWEK